MLAKLDKETVIDIFEKAKAVLVRWGKEDFESLSGQERWDFFAAFASLGSTCVADEVVGLQYMEVELAKKVAFEFPSIMLKFTANVDKGASFIEGVELFGVIGLPDADSAPTTLLQLESLIQLVLEAKNLPVSAPTSTFLERHWDTLLYAIRDTVVSFKSDPKGVTERESNKDKQLYFSVFADSFFSVLTDVIQVERCSDYTIDDIENYELYQLLSHPTSARKDDGTLVLEVAVKRESHAYDELTIPSQDVYLFCRKIEDAQFVVELREKDIARYFIF